ncbi:MAG: tetratricopeptide repeat protein [Thermoguttaceae bacterium]|nr:tetratricopeptide repeat protein [Thermoguttaceae bacterium]
MRSSTIRQAFVLVVLLAGLGPFLSSACADPVAADVLDAPATPEQAIPEVTEAVERFKQQDFGGALDLLKKAAGQNADLPPAQIVMAQLFSQANQGNAVRVSLERAVVEAPEDPEAYVIMGDIAMAQGRVTEASLLYDKAQALLANFTKSDRRKAILDARNMSGLAAVAEARGDWETAEKRLTAWQKLDPKNAVCLQRLARARFQQRSPGDALKLLREAATLDENVLTPEAQLARFYHEFGDQKNAQIWIDGAIKVAPKDVRTRLVAAQWYLETNQLEKASKEAQEATQLDPKSLEAKLFRGVVALFLKDYKSAETYFEQAHLQSPGNFAASNNLALALIEQDDDQKRRRALEYATANARQNPRATEALSTYGWVQYKLGNVDEADRVLQGAAGTGTLSPDTAYYLAVVSAEKGRKEQAVQLLNAALNTTQPFSQRQEAKVLLDQLTR